MDRIAYSQASHMDTGSQVKKENQETSLRAKACKYLGFAVTTALLAGSAVASGTEGLSMPEPPSSALRLRDNNNLTDQNPSWLNGSPDTTTNLMGPFSPPPLPSPEHLRRIGVPDPEHFYQEASRRTSSGETSQSVRENRSNLQNQGLRLRRKKVTLARLSKAQSDSHLRETIPSEKTPRSTMEISSFEESILPLLNEKALARDLALIQEHPEKPRTHVRKILWDNRYDYEYDYKYGNKYKSTYRKKSEFIFPLTKGIYDKLNAVTIKGLQAAEWLTLIEGVYAVYHYGYKRCYQGLNAEYNGPMMRLRSVARALRPVVRELRSLVNQWWRGRNAGHNLQNDEAFARHLQWLEWEQRPVR